MRYAAIDSTLQVRPFQIRQQYYKEEQQRIPGRRKGRQMRTLTPNIGNRQKIKFGRRETSWIVFCEKAFLLIFIKVCVLPKSQKQSMKNNFVSCFPFHIKESGNTSKSQSFFLARHPQTSFQNTEKKITLQYQSNQVGGSAKQVRSTQEDSINSKGSQQLSSCTSSQITPKPNINQNRLGREHTRAASPARPEVFSPRPTLSPAREGPLGVMPFVSRTTLKHIVQNKPSRHEEETSLRVCAALKDNFHSPLKGIEKENQILREENQLLRRELSAIKRDLLSEACKKEENISNLRSTIKREDGEIKDLRAKLDLATKKNAALATLVQTREEEVAFLSGKLAEMQVEFSELKERNAEKFEKLKERINLVLKNYGQLEVKWSKAEMEWLSFKEKWMQEKGIYMHRINFLQQYIANN